MTQSPRSGISVGDLLRRASQEEDVNLEQWVRALEEGMAMAIARHYQTEKPVQVHLDPDAATFQAWIVKQVVSDVQNPALELTVQEARDHDASAEIGSEVYFHVSTEGLDHLAIQYAARVSAQEAKVERIYNKYIHRVGDVLSGTVRYVARGDILVDLDDAEAIVPVSEQPTQERVTPGQPIVGILTDVHHQPDGPQLVLSLTDHRLKTTLFEQAFEKSYPVDLTRIPGVGPKTAESLQAFGFGTVKSLREATTNDLLAVRGVGPKIANEIVRWVRGKKEFDEFYLLTEPMTFFGEAVEDGAPDFAPAPVSQLPTSFRCIAEPTDSEQFFHRALQGLGSQSWVLENARTQPFRLNAYFPPGLSEEDLVELLMQSADYDVDLSTAMGGGLGAETELVFLAVYPSGTVRGFSARISDDRPDHLIILDPSAILDPEASLDLPYRPPWQVELVGIEAPS